MNEGTGGGEGQVGRWEGAYCFGWLREGWNGEGGGLQSRSRAMA